MILRDLASALGCTVKGDGGVEVTRVAGIEEAGPGDLTFVSNPKYASRLAATKATAVIVAPDVATDHPSLVSRNPYLTYARAASLLHPEPRPSPGVHASAAVDPTAVLGEGVHVGPLAVVGARTRVGARTVVHALVALAEDVVVGEDCRLHSGAQVREGCRLGDRVVLQNGAVIGADGFGFAKDEEGRYHKIPHRGIVVLEDDVEIGANSAIDRAAHGQTRIGRGVKIDNLVQIGHSVSIGADSVLAGQVGIAGSTKVGARVTLAGQVGVAGHISIGDGVVATAQTGIPNSVDAGKVLSGYPAIDNRDWLKSSAVFSKLPELLKRVRELEREIQELKNRLGTA
jgi:UDP-3-O-[3-hydroxymyristoyl] glucosamine N-acyltransferase